MFKSSLQLTDLLTVITKKLHILNSRFLDPLSSGIDAFTFHWSVDINWLVWPVSLFAHTIKHIQLCKAEGIVSCTLVEIGYILACVGFS